MIRFYNGYILSFGGGISLRSGEVWTEAEKIVYVGNTPPVLPEFEREIDLAGDVIMPGFKNAHTHSAMVLFRSLADDMELHQWLSERIWPNEARMDEDAVYDLTKLAIMEYLSSGITASFDMYVKNDQYAKANVDAGFRTVICSGMNDFDRDITNIEREYIKFNSYHPLISYSLGIHGEYTTGLERLEYMASLVEKYKSPCFTHLCETAEEVQGCLDRHGMTPPRILDKLGLFRYGGGGYHCVWLTEDDMELMADRGLWAVTCPGSNLKLASGIAPVDMLASKGVNLAIGTDGAGSNNALDFFREMFLVSVLQKQLKGDASAGCADRTLQMACVGGARAMGLADSDDLAVGKLADLVVIDMKSPNMQPVNNVARNLVYSGSKSNVRLTMVNGVVRYERGEYFIGENTEDLYRRINEHVARIIR